MRVGKTRKKGSAWCRVRITTEPVQPMACLPCWCVAHVGAHAHRIRPAAQWSEYSDTPAGFVYLKLAIAQVLVR